MTGGGRNGRGVIEGRKEGDLRERGQEGERERERARGRGREGWRERERTSERENERQRGGREGGACQKLPPKWYVDRLLK